MSSGTEPKPAVSHPPVNDSPATHLQGTYKAPIFVRAPSRSGGTLVCTLLDSHKDISMGQELYPELLATEEPVDCLAFADMVESAGELREARRVCPTERFGTYLIRYMRSGLDHTDFATHLRTLVAEGLSLESEQGRFRMLELAGVQKAEIDGKRYWGAKCMNDLASYLGRWPEARLIDVIRDGRDALASQLYTTRSGRTPAQVAKGWASTHRKFREFQAKHPESACILQYERLAVEPEMELRKLCDFLNLEFDTLLLQHHRQPHAVFGANHISGPRITKPIDNNQVGRWKTELTEDELAEFMAVAGNELEELGYI